MNIRPQNLYEKQEISIKLGAYEDIFSDFDMRDHSSRALSVDFLDEIKRASVDKMDDLITLELHVPENNRDTKMEEIIKVRLGNHFKRHYLILLKEKRQVLGLGISMAVIGIIFMIITTRLIFNGHDENQILTFLVVFLEPIALFLLWEGMDRIFFNSRDINPNLFFYKKMFKAHDRIEFRSY